MSHHHYHPKKRKYRAPSSSRAFNTAVVPTAQYGYGSLRIRPEDRLPLELYGQIIKELRDYPSTLLNLLVASREIHAEAERILYEYVSLYKPHAQRKFCLQILARPHLASLVRQYHYSREYRSSLVETTQPEATNEDFDLLARVLPMLVGLKDLKFYHECELEETACPTYILDNCTFQLKSFDWNSHCCTDRLIPFLRKPELHGLRHLGLGAWPDGLNPDGLWPNLRSLAGPDDTMVAVLPRSGLIQLYWIIDMSLEEIKRSIRAIQKKIRPYQTLCNIRILSFLHDLKPVEQPDAFIYLGKLFPSLEILEDIQYYIADVSSDLILTDAPELTTPRLIVDFQ
jgi:hypothetical protein